MKLCASWSKEHTRNNHQPLKTTGTSEELHLMVLFQQTTEQVEQSNQPLVLISKSPRYQVHQHVLLGISSTLPQLQSAPFRLL